MERVHPTTIEGYSGDLTDLGRDLGRLRFDALLCVLTGLARELDKQESADAQIGRVELSAVLKNANTTLCSTVNHLSVAWRISKPFMDDEIRNVPKLFEESSAKL